ncbi:putative quinol monooxygenase [Microbacterium pygmaeum]|uniref:Antibiotic biosynthesis monooxygenase n=1 Tax=Microbacterium pygmaeum TaxID=370764 RepID=A0A1G7Y619_9MICO|nr:antibiotic biosynthesis monooxygenase [Microbacterium pygmaeum]SDG91783.1 Antibiotic biosynthesis monooxygenase [Microbacterium pygmaeum]
MSELTGVGRFTFKDGQVEEFKRLSERCMQIVREQDTGTLQYDIFVSDDQSEAVVIERYRDSKAHTEHLEHIGPDLLNAVIATTATVEGWTLGNPTEEVRQKLADTEVRLLPTFLSLNGDA